MTTNKRRLVFGPGSEKHRLFLTDNTTNILIVGGGAGCGKSMCSLLRAVACVDDPNARVVIYRRTYTQLSVSGGLIDESKKIYKHFGGSYNKQHKLWTFPSGATIAFSYMPDDLGELQGLQATMVIIDEVAEEFTEEEVLFLNGRLRNGDYTGHRCLIATCNPNQDSFLFEWVKFCLDEVTGVPKPGTEHIIRYFSNVAGKTIWGSSAKEVKDIVRKEFGDLLAEQTIPLSFRYIPMTIVDNPDLLKSDPGYLSRLRGQSVVNQLRFIDGSWTARPDGEGHFRKSWVLKVPTPHPEPVFRIRAWDLAGTLPSESNKNPDYTAGVLMSRDRFGIYYIEDVVRFRALPDTVLKEIISTAYRDGPSTIVTIPKEVGVGGKFSTNFLLRSLAEAGVSAKAIEVSGHSGKVQKFLPFCTLAEGGAVRYVSGDWNDAYLSELESFTGSRKLKDDQVDATSDAFNTISKSLTLPVMVIPSMSMPNFLPQLTKNS